MRYAVISDIHGNIEALKSVLKSIRQNRIDEVLCLGDIVGYGPNPNECVEIIRKRQIKTVVGNHDFVMIDAEWLEHFNPAAREAALWTKSLLKPDNLKYLACLPFSFQLPDILLVHGSPVRPGNFSYIFDIIMALGQFNGFKGKICFVGHSHVPGIFTSDGDFIKESNVKLKDGVRYIINVGSVGQPRDDNPLACYGIWDADTLTFSLIRVNYQIRKTAKKIAKARLPIFLAERLFKGR